MSTPTLPTDLPTCVARYRSVHGLDAQITDTGRIIVRAGDLGCVRLPTELGKLITTELARRGLVTPIIIDDASASLRFLTQRPETDPLFDPLFMYGAKQAGFGAEISLPTPGYPRRRWLHAPVGTQRLPSMTIVEIALAQAESHAKTWAMS